MQSRMFSSTTTQCEERILIMEWIEEEEERFVELKKRYFKESEQLNQLEYELERSAEEYERLRELLNERLNFPSFHLFLFSSSRLFMKNFFNSMQRRSMFSSTTTRREERILIMEWIEEEKERFVELKKRYVKKRVQFNHLEYEMERSEEEYERLRELLNERLNFSSFHLFLFSSSRLFMKNFFNSIPKRTFPN